VIMMMVIRRKRMTVTKIMSAVKCTFVQHKVDKVLRCTTVSK